MMELLQVQTLDVISVNIWQILISLANLLLIFLILKKLLWKPVQKVMQQRQDMVDQQFADAAEAEAQAEADKALWAEKLASADEEAKARIAEATEDARRYREGLVNEANEEAHGIRRRAEEDAALERRKATAALREEIADLSAELAEKMLEREINADDHRAMIASFLDEVGDA
ncbi:MAG: F0F1 ATP synthase subunit B [Clostridia bacterium]|nr:F0F1 ATP synthase subunit B [Clostridia bacterium]